MTDIKSLQKTSINRLDELKEVGKQLKIEFVGINSVIDEIIDAIASWYLFPDIQEVPLKLNLWGMTGVAKTDLIRRLTYHLNFSDRHYEFDLGKNSDRNDGISSTLEEIFQNESGDPIIICLDEFQLGRTIDEFGCEIDRSSLRVVWELLDSGRLHAPRSFFSYERVFNLSKVFHYLIEKGVKVVKGRVVHGLPLFRKAFDISKTDNETQFVQNNYLDDVFEMYKGVHNSEIEVRHLLENFNEIQTLSFVASSLKHMASPKIIDLSKSLIFVLGNLDEAYTMSDDYNGDVDADQFHKLSLKIDLPTIKNALKLRFRNEQISRLGSTHIVYPAFSKSSFHALIDLKLKAYLDKMSEKFKIEIIADSSIGEMVFNEGVIPTQGARPILSCIDQNVKAKTVVLMTKFFNSGHSANKMVLASNGKEITAFFYKNEKLQIKLSEKIHQKVLILKTNKKDDKQALIAVHEAGHAIISMVLLSTYPEEIFSQAMDKDKMGFMYANFEWDIMPRKDMLNRVAFYMGGLAAETIVFGKNYTTLGASNDLETATAFVSEIVRRSGLGEIPANIQTRHYMASTQLHDEENNKEIKNWLQNGNKLALSTLDNYYNLLISLSDFLSDRRTIQKSAIEEMVKILEPELANDIENFKGYHRFRETLKGKYNKMMDIDKDALNFSNIILNKSK